MKEGQPVPQPEPKKTGVGFRIPPGTVIPEAPWEKEWREYEEQHMDRPRRKTPEPCPEPKITPKTPQQ